MALRPFFALIPGLPSPGNFKAGAAPLLAIGELWEAVRNCGPSLLFRVLAEGPDALQATDQLESCVGLIDSATRWRTSFRLTNNVIGAVRHPQLAQACAQALQFIAGQHPANVGPAQRKGVQDDLMRIAGAEATDTQPAAHPFEQQIARGVAGLVFSETDYEASYHVPFLGALCPFEEGTPQYKARLASLEMTAGAALLDQASARLAERMPSWLAVKMPELSAGGDREED